MIISMKRLLIDAIVGRGLRDIAQAERLTRDGYAKFCGNQHNPEWMWCRDKLETFTEGALLDLYQQMIS